MYSQKYVGTFFGDQSAPSRAYLLYLIQNSPAAEAKNITTICTISVCIPFEILRGSMGRLEYLGN